MKHSTWSRLLLAVAVLLCLGLLLFLRPGGQPRKPAESAPATNEPAQEAVVPHPQNPSNEPLRNPGEGQQNLAATSAAVLAGMASRAEQLKGAVETRNVPIVFWGKVVDQDNAPLPGVKVRTSVRRWQVIASPLGDATFPRTETSTGSDGQFAIDGGKGDSLTIEALEKEGYTPEPRALRTVGYTPPNKFTPDPKNPLVLRMWKADLKAQLVRGSKRCSLVPDGRVYTLDLLTGTLAESPAGEGDLRFSFQRPADAVWGRRQHFDWSMEIQAVRGGFLEELDIYSAMFQAPQEGYTNPYTMKMAATASSWSGSTGRKRFYLKSRDGQNFARLEIFGSVLNPQDKQARLNISYAVNASGERLLK
jgi:hypothetical protein